MEERTVIDEAGVWTVLWKTEPRGEAWLLDFDSEEGAHNCGIRVTQQGGLDVFVSGPQLVDADPVRDERIAVRVYQVVAARRAEQLKRKDLQIHEIRKEMALLEAQIAVAEFAGRPVGAMA